MATPATRLQIEYTAVPGYFVQDEAETDASSLDCWTTQNFGLISRPYASDSTFDPDRTRTTQWARFAHHIRSLNLAELERENKENDSTATGEGSEASVKYRYKVLFLGRHGEGYHNAAESKYGKEAWDNYWSLLPGDATSYWVDSELSPLGIEQAVTANKAWAQQFSQGLPVPDAFYTSPHVRCLRTANYTFGGLQVPVSKSGDVEWCVESSTSTSPLHLQLRVKELLREVISPHTCDQRSSKTRILSLFSSNSPSPYSNDNHHDPNSNPASSTTPTPFKPDIIIDDAHFAETDPFWSPTFQETDDMVQSRLRTAFDDVLEQDRPGAAEIGSGTNRGKDVGKEFVSFTMHSGAIRNTLALLGHRPFYLWPCGMIPVVVRVGYH